MDENLKVLLVDDHAENRLALRAILDGTHFTCLEAESGEQALEVVANEEVDLILLDVCMGGMGGMDGFECAAILQSQSFSQHIPILFVTAIATDVTSVAKAYSLGAVDYLVKPLDVDVVRHRVAVFANQVLMRRRLRHQQALLHKAQRKAYERELASLRLASAPRYQKLVAGIARTIEWSVDTTDWRLTFVSQQAQNIFAVDAASLKQPAFFQHYAAPQERDMITQMFERAVQSKEDQSFVHRMVCASGAITWLHTGVGVLGTEDAPCRELHGVSVDITALKQNEIRQGILAELCLQTEDLQDHRSILRRLLPLTLPELADWCLIDELQGPTAMLQLGSAHRDPSCQALLRTFTQPRLMVLGKGRGIAQVVADGNSRSFADADRALPLGTILAVPAAAVLQDLECHACLVIPLQARGRVFGTVTLGKSGPRRTFHPEEVRLAEEICQRMALLADNAILHKESLHARTVRERLLTIVAHDLRNPLFSISTHAALLSRSASSDIALERCQRLAPKIKKTASHMGQLIDDLLDFSRITQGGLQVDMQPVDLSLLFDEVATMLQPVADARGKRLVLGGAQQLRVKADGHRVVQILANLIGNAVKFSAAGSTIHVEAKLRAKAVEISVTNSGEPIAPEDIDHIFETFYRGSGQRREGLGLGLHIVRGLVEAQGGQIWLRSSRVSGTCFTFSLLCAPPQSSVVAKNTRPSLSLLS